MKELFEQIRQCNRCQLRSNCISPLIPLTTNLSKVFVISCKPNTEDMIQDRMFSDRPGRFVKKLLEQEFPINNIHFTSLVKCPETKRQKPTKSSINICSDFLQKEFELIKPKLIILLGQAVFDSILRKRLAEETVYSEVLWTVIKNQESYFLVCEPEYRILSKKKDEERFVNSIRRLKSCENI